MIQRLLAAFEDAVESFLSAVVDRITAAWIEADK
jgi:hypothetical protein